MKKTIKYIALLALGTSLVVSCDPEFENDIDPNAITPQSSGSVDFSKYVALGNSLTAGMAENTLYVDGQLAAFPNILAEQMKAAGGGEFTIPLAASNAGGLTVGGQEITNPCSGMNQFPKRTVLSVVNGERGVNPYGGPGDPSEATAVVQGPFNNLGVPGAKSFHLLADGYGNPANIAAGLANPYFVRMASSPDTSILKDALAQNPTFFTLWIGNNDALDYATRGGVPTSDDPICGGDLTDPTLFTQAYGGIIQTLMTATQANGVLINLPSVTDIPFFTTVPYNPIPMDAATAAGTNMAYAAYNGGLQSAVAAAAFGVPFTAEEAARRTINFKEGQNPVVIFDESLTDLAAFADLNPALAGLAQLPQIRQATAEDLLVLTSSAVIGTQLQEGNPATTVGVGVPLEDKWVLTPAEQAEIAAAQEAFNGVISGIIAQNEERLALFDAKSVLNEVATSGLAVDGGVLTSTFASGGTFGLDGVHLTPRANAVIANGIIDVINEKFGATLEKVRPGTYQTIPLE